MRRRATIGATTAACDAAPAPRVVPAVTSCQRALALVLTVLAWLAPLLVGATASAQDEGALDAIERSLTDRTTSSARDGIQPPSIQPAALDARWHILREAPAGTEQEERAFEALRTTALELGITSLPAHSLVLLQQADEALSRGDTARAMLLRDRAALLDPDSAQPAFFDARVAWMTSPWNAPRILRALGGAYVKMNASIAGRHALASQWRQFAGLALVVLSFLVCTLLMFRHGGRLAYDVRLAALRAPSLPQARALVALVIIAPALVLWSPFVFAVTCAVLVAVYLTLPERVIATILMAGLCALPGLASQYASAIESADGDDVRALPAGRQPCDVRCERELARIIERSDNAVAALSLAWVDYRRGTVEGRARASERLASRSFTGALESSAETLRGNIAVLAGDPDTAQRAYERAAASAASQEQAAAAWYNLFRLHTLHSRTDAAAQAIRNAYDAGGSSIDPWVNYEGRSQNLVLMSSPIPPSVGLHVAPAPENRWLIDGAVDELMAPWLGAVPVETSLTVAAGAAAWLVLSWLVARSRVVAIRCTRCTTPISRFVYEPAWEARLCVLCYQARTVPGELTREQLVAREQRVDDWRALSRRASVIAAFIMPGAAQIVAGRVASGFLLLTTFALGVGLFIVDPTPMAVPYSLGTDRLFDGRLQLAATLIAVSFLGSLVLVALDARRRR